VRRRTALRGRRGGQRAMETEVWAVGAAGSYVRLAQAQAWRRPAGAWPAVLDPPSHRPGRGDAGNAMSLTMNMTTYARAA
jgi:hypothetical protein